MKLGSPALPLFFSLFALQAFGAKLDTPEKDVACSASVGMKKAMEYVQACSDISPATRPPCNIANSCKAIVDEIKRGCAMGGAGLRMCLGYNNEDHLLGSEATLKGFLSSEIVKDTDPKITFTIRKLKLLHPIDVFDEDGGISQLGSKVVQTESHNGRYPRNNSCVIITGRLVAPVTLTDVYPVVIEAERISNCGN